MKCEENGGCPFRGDGYEKLEGYCLLYGEVGVSGNEDGFGDDNGRLESYHNCHLTSDLFPILRATMAGRIKVHAHHAFKGPDMNGVARWRFDIDYEVDYCYAG